MARPGDWSPVDLGADPTPGEPGAIADLATRYSVRESELRNALDQVNLAYQSLQSGEAWTGIAASAAADTAFESSTLLARVAEQQGGLGRTLHAWSGEVEELQRRADDALRRAIEARDERSAAEARVTYAETESMATARALASMASDDDRFHLRQTRQREAQFARQELSRAQDQVGDAQARLTSAITDAAHVRDEYDTSAREYAAAFSASADAVDGLGTVPAGFESAMLALASGGSGLTTPEQLLKLLKTLTPEQLAALAAENPSFLQALWDDQPPPDEIAKWWNGLSDSERSALVLVAPAVVGNLAGVPYGVRNTANNAVLRDARAHYDELTEAQRNAIDHMDSLRNLANDAGVPFQITSLNLGAHPPLGAFAFGDLDTASNVTWAAPGMENDFDNTDSSWGRATLNLYGEQVRLGASPAVVGWMGYDTPDFISVLDEGLARTGADRFATEIDGTYSVRSSSAAGLPHIAVVAHSYGTTMAADALVQTKHPVDSFTMVGSAGIDQGRVENLSDLNVKHVDGAPAIYTTSATLDELAPYGAYLGGRENPNPTQTDFRGWDIRGAQSFSSDGTGSFGPTSGHGVIGHGDERSGFIGAEPPTGEGYFDPRTQSLRGIAATSTGQPDRVPGGLVPTADQVRR